MKVELESSLERWVAAQILDADQAARIRQWEFDRVPEGRSRWQIVVALVFGGVMLAAGVLLFVSAHWDELSPVQRMALLGRRFGISMRPGRARRARLARITIPKRI